MRYSHSLILGALLACAEVEADEGWACLVPVGLSCSDCNNPSFTICSFTPQTIEGEWRESCTQGELPADTRLRVEVNFGIGRGDSWDHECSVEQTGDRELRIHASYRWRPDGDADQEPDMYTACETPPLAAGVWTIRYGQGELALDIGATERPLVCVDSGER